MTVYKLFTMTLKCLCSAAVYCKAWSELAWQANIIPDKYSEIKKRIETIVSFYDSFSKTCSLSLYVFDTTVKIIRDVLESQCGSRKAFRFRTYERVILVWWKCVKCMSSLSKMELGDFFVFERISLGIGSDAFLGYLKHIEIHF